MKKIFALLLVLLLCAAPACAELLQIGDFGIEIPAGYVGGYSEEDGGYIYANTEGVAHVIMLTPVEDDMALADFVDALVPITFSGEEDVLVDHDKTIGSHKFSRASHRYDDGSTVKLSVYDCGSDFAIWMTLTAAGADLDDMEYANMLSSVQLPSNYEIVSTDEYARTPWQGIIFRVYVEEPLTEELAKLIYRDLFTESLGYDIYGVFFYDMISAADGSGSALGRILQEDVTDFAPEFESYE